MLEGKRIVILVEHEYQDMEVWYPYLRFLEAGAEVFIVGTGTAEHYKGKFGYPITVDRAINGVKADEIDCVIIPGGWAPDRIRLSRTANNFVADMFNSDKVVAAICHGPSVLVSAKVLKGKTITCYKAIKDDCIAAGAHFVDEEVVIDGKLITSRNPMDLPAFCREIIKVLKNEK